MTDLYPVTIITTRYGGAYEEDEWAAFHCNPEEVPSAATGEDTLCFNWWTENKSRVGVGATPNAAYVELLRKQDLKGIE